MTIGSVLWTLLCSLRLPVLPAIKSWSTWWQWTALKSVFNILSPEDTPHQKAAFLPFGVTSGCGDKLQTIRRLGLWSFSTDAHGATGARKGVGYMTSAYVLPFLEDLNFLQRGHRHHVHELRVSIVSRMKSPAFPRCMSFLQAVMFMANLGVCCAPSSCLNLFG